LRRAPARASVAEAQVAEIVCSQYRFARSPRKQALTAIFTGNFSLTVAHLSGADDADHLGARVLLGDVLASQGKYSAAVEEYRDALTGHPELRFIEARIRALEMLKQPQKAATRPILNQ